MKSLDKIQFFGANFLYCNCNVAEGGPVQKKGVILWQKAFSNIGLYWPRDNKSVARNINFQKSFFCETASISNDFNDSKYTAKIEI